MPNDPLSYPPHDNRRGELKEQFQTAHDGKTPPSKQSGTRETEQIGSEQVKQQQPKPGPPPPSPGARQVDREIHQQKMAKDDQQAKIAQARAMADEINKQKQHSGKQADLDNGLDRR